MIKFVLYILFISSFSFCREIYQEIKVYNSTLPFLKSIGVDFDHVHSSNDHFKFIISEDDINKLKFYNVNFDIIHNDIEHFYQSRLSNDYDIRDFELGSMGGYYTYVEIENRLNDIANSYPELVSLIPIGITLEGRERCTKGDYQNLPSMLNSTPFFTSAERDGHPRPFSGPAPRPGLPWTRLGA